MSDNPAKMNPALFAYKLMKDAGSDDRVDPRAVLDMALYCEELVEAPQDDTEWPDTIEG